MKILILILIALASLNSTKKKAVPEYQYYQEETSCIQETEPVYEEIVIVDAPASEETEQYFEIIGEDGGEIDISKW